MPPKPIKTSLHSIEEIQWVKQKEIKSCTFIGKETLAIAFPGTISFVNLNDGKEIFYHAMNIDNGYGVACVASHMFYKIFAFAEITLQPRIMLYSYPEFQQINIFQNADTGRYIFLEFSETEHLVALTGIPNYKIEIWNWRTGKLLAQQETGILSDIQHLRCSRTSPLTIIHMATNQHKMNVWEVYGTQEKANLVKRNIKIPCQELEKPFFFTFAVDGSFYLINKLGSIWNINPVTSKNNRIIEWPGDKGNLRTFISLYRGGLLISGPDGSIKYFKKSANIWQEQFTINQLVHQLKMINCFQQECFIGCTFNGSIIKLIDDQELPGERHFTIVKEYHEFFHHFISINPLGEHIAVISNFNELSIIEMSTAKLVSKLSVENVVYMICHPSAPIIVLGTTNGWIGFLCVMQPDQPKWIGEFYLSNYEISSCQFSQEGRILIVFDIVNDWFLLKTFLDKEILICHHETFQFQPKCLSVYFANNSTVFITSTVLPLVATRMKICTDLGVQIQFSLENSSVNKTEFLLPKEYFLLLRLSENDPTKFLGIPADEVLNKQTETLEILNITLNDQLDVTVKILRIVKTMHESSYFMARIYKDFILTWGMDGRVIIWDKITIDMIHTFVPHNRYLGGIENAVADFHRRHILTFGNGDNLLCTKLKKNTYDRDEFTLIQRAIKRLDINMTPPKETFEKSYVDRKAEEQQAIEREKFKKEREMILNSFKHLQDKLKILIDKNEEAPSEEQLPIEAFNLDEVGTEIHRELARKERECETKTTQQWCSKENNATDWIIENTWNKMNVKGTSLRGIFTKLKVDNYPLLNTEGNDDDLKRITLMRSKEYRLSRNDVFQPWKPIDSNDLESKLAQISQYYEPGELSSMGSYSTDQSSEIGTGCKKYSFSGTSSHLYIKPLPMRYNQMEVVTYHQMLAETTMTYHDALALRKYFNGIFDKMMEMKSIEMNLVQQRHDRLRYIQDELNILEKLKHTEVVHRDELIDPKYKPDEQPETIVKVEDDEVSIPPYISPSRQQLLDEQIAIAEARRLAMLADDFRERALIKMMDGVLEIRWEDEIKKSPPKPECISLDKDPKDYTEEDLLSIKKYEEELRQLGYAREKYRQMLTEEKTKIYRNLNDQIHKFNYKVGETLLQKLRVEFAIGSEELKLLGNFLFNFQRKDMAQKEANIQSDICKIKEEIENLTTIFSSLEDSVLSCRNKYEELSSKDRLLEKQFKSSFSEYASQAIVDQAYRIFRRRPKWQMRASHTATILQDMGKRINSAVSGRSPLPEECFKYLDLLETAEKFTQAPNLMDQNMWAILCRMRRVKIEIEFRVRSCGAQLAEAESTLNAFNKEINSKRTKLAQLEKSLVDIREDQKLHKINRSVQICMKRGNVEIPLTGKLTDFDDAILLHATDVQSINQIIKKAGEKKLKAMEKSALFRRKIIHKEWEHKVLKLKIEEKKNFIKLIEGCKITKEVQLWLQWKQINRPVELTESMIERKNKAMTSLLEKQCREIQSKINVTNNQIASKRNENVVLDKRIQHLNLFIAEQTAMRNIEREMYDAAEHKKRLSEIVERSRLIRKVQQQHCKVLELTTLLELLKLRTYPTLPEKK